MPRRILKESQKETRRLCKLMAETTIVTSGTEDTGLTYSDLIH